MMGVKVLLAGLLGLGMVLGGTVAESANLREMREAACCAAIVEDEAGVGLTTGGWARMMPQACQQHGVGCPALGFDPPAAVMSPEEKAQKAVDEQLELRFRPTCDQAQWRGRCPSGSSMILANVRGGCLAAGCAHGGDVAVMEEDAEESVLRAVVAHESHLLEGTTFQRHALRLRKAFMKGQEAYDRDVEAALASPIDVDYLRMLIDRGTRAGFAGQLEAARSAVFQHDAQQWALAHVRRLPGAVMSKIAREKLAVRKKLTAKEQVIAGLEQQVEDLQQTVNDLQLAAAAEAQRWTDTQKRQEAKIVAGAARELKLRAKVKGLESATKEVRRTSEETARRLESQMASQRALLEEMSARAEEAEAEGEALRREVAEAERLLTEQRAAKEEADALIVDIREDAELWAEKEEEAQQELTGCFTHFGKVEFALKELNQFLMAKAAEEDSHIAWSEDAHEPFGLFSLFRQPPEDITAPKGRILPLLSDIRGTAESLFNQLRGDINECEEELERASRGPEERPQEQQRDDR